jgi:hypothetical protein
MDICWARRQKKRHTDGLKMRKTFPSPVTGNEPDDNDTRTQRVKISTLLENALLEIEFRYRYLH